jgi:hypothetical protein
MGEPLVRVVVSISYDTLPCCLQDCALTFGEHGFPNLTGFSLAKTRGSGHKLVRSVRTYYLSFLRNVYYISHFTIDQQKMHDK